MCIDAYGHVYIMDVGNNRVHMLTPRGHLLGFIHVDKTCGTFDPPPSGIAITRNGHLILGNALGHLKILQVELTKDTYLSEDDASSGTEWLA